MALELIGILFFVLLFVFLFAGMPIGFALSLSGILGLFVCFGVDATLSQLGIVPFSSVANPSFSVVPLSILTGTLASRTGIINEHGHGLTYDAWWASAIPWTFATALVGLCATAALIYAILQHRTSYGIQHAKPSGVSDVAPPAASQGN